jgi:hypothetical protein
MGILEPFTNSRKTVQFSSVTGEVVGSSKISETHVSSSTQTTYNYHTDGTSTSTTRSVPHVYSVIKQEFHLRPKGGREVPVQLTGSNVPVHDGQTVTMISGGVRSDGQDSRWVRMAVHDTNMWYGVSNDGMLRHQWRLVSKTKWVLTLLGLMIFGTFLLAIYAEEIITNSSLYCGSFGCNIPPDAASATNFALSIWILSILGFVAWLFVSNRKYRGLKRRLTAHLNMLANAALAAKPLVA